MLVFYMQGVGLPVGVTANSGVATFSAFLLYGDRQGLLFLEISQSIFDAGLSEGPVVIAPLTHDDLHVNGVCLCMENTMYIWSNHIYDQQKCH